MDSSQSCWVECLGRKFGVDIEDMGGEAVVRSCSECPSGSKADSPDGGSGSRFNTGSRDLVNSETGSGRGGTASIIATHSLILGLTDGSRSQHLSSIVQRVGDKSKTEISVGETPFTILIRHE